MRITANGPDIYDVAADLFGQPVPQFNDDLELKLLQKLIEIRKAGTAADSSTTADVISGSRHIANTHVRCSGTMVVI